MFFDHDPPEMVISLQKGAYYSLRRCRGSRGEPRFLFLGTLVVVLVEYVGADVHPVADDFFGYVFREVVGDTPPANVVWRDVHWTLAVTVVVRPLTGLRVASTGTLNAVVAGARDLVDGISDIRA